MTIKEIVPQFMEYKANYVKRSTMSAYMLLCQNHVLPDFGECESITEEFIQNFVLRKINSGLSQKTVVDILVVVKMILKYAAKRKLFEYQIWDIIYPSEQKNHKIEVLTKSDHKKVLHHIVENFSFKNLGIFICLSTGMRIGEICALRWEDLDIETGIISIGRTIQRIYTIGDGEGKGKTEVVIDNPKTKCSNREIPMSIDLLKMIKPIKKIVNDSYYLLTNDKKPTEPRTYRSYYHEFMKGIDVPVIKFHSLRHTFATRCIESGCDIKTTSVILGHSNVSTTLNIYVHPNNDQKKKAIDHMFKAMR